MSDDPLSFVQDELADAQVFDFELPLSYFDAELPAPVGTTSTGQLSTCSAADPDETEEWSSFVAPEVRNAVLATIAEVAPGFFGDQCAEFAPAGPEDEDQAEQETILVNHTVMSICKGFEPLVRAISEALLYGFGVVRVAWDTRKKVSGRRLNGVSPEQVAMLEMSGQMAGAEEGEDGYMVDLRVEELVSKPVLEWVPAHQLRVAKHQTLTDMDDVRFIAWVRGMTRSELLTYGIPRDLVDRLETTEDSNKAYASQMVMVCEAYALFDSDGDGIAERRRLLTGGGVNGDQVLLDDQPWTGQPFAVGVPLFDIDSWAGIGLFERLKQVQDAKTDLQRQMILTGWRNLLQRLWGLEETYNPEDLEGSVRGGVVRVTSPSAIGTLPDVPLSPVSFQLLDVLDKARRESGGGAIDTAAYAQNIGGDTAHGVERAMSSLEQVGVLVARVLAETLIKPVYIKVHTMLRENWEGVLQARASGRWMVQRPAQWTPREDVSVMVGISTFDRRSLAAAVAQVLQQQMAAMQSGQDGVLVGTKQIHNSLVDFARLMGLPAPEQYWVDPASPEGQQAAQQKSQQAEAEKQQAAAAAKMQLDSLERLEQIKAEVDRYKVDWDHVASVNADLLKLIELSAKYTAEDIADVEQFKVNLGCQNAPQPGN